MTTRNAFLILLVVMAFSNAVLLGLIYEQNGDTKTLAITAAANAKENRRIAEDNRVILAALCRPVSGSVAALGAIVLRIETNSRLDAIERAFWRSQRQMFERFAREIRIDTGRCKDAEDGVRPR